ncbi:hypothetical protein PILCRDRAFT_1549 [Piloderma croceum F 1598]|uniref:Uncharacterized protein n=1 Tax=Piloderma croceum (strain F 1598) TaxID=765440 RepID=A0A0C3CKK1_PILCF|nr:hypothetical protein PILCRDRAFT_1549 [Piloderma croceum F 1598]
MSEVSDSESVADSHFDSGSINSNDPDLAGVMFPLVTTYVVFSIDPVATLASLDDPEVTVATSRLHPKKYVGFVRNTASAHNADAEFMAYKIELLRQGPTPELKERFIESDMCVPVLPNTAQHPLNRPPLRPTIPLPWADCYHSSFDTVTVRVAMQRADATAAVRIPFEEMGKQMYFKLTDRARQRALREARGLHSQSLPQSDAYRPADSLEEAHTSSYHEAHADTPHDTSGEAGDPDALDEEIQVIVAMMDETRAPNTMPLAVMTYDLSTVEAVSDPRDFLEECRVLKQLEHEHYARNKADTAAAIERARKVDDEAFAGMSRPPQPTRDPVPVPVEASAVQTRPSAWRSPKRAIIAINQYLHEHPFWGEPVDPPPAIVLVFRRLGAKLGKIVRLCACGTLGPGEGPSKSRQQSEKTAMVLNEKVPVTVHRRVSSEVLTPQSERNLESTQSREKSASQAVQQPQQQKREIACALRLLPNLSAEFKKRTQGKLLPGLHRLRQGTKTAEEERGDKW